MRATNNKMTEQGKRKETKKRTIKKKGLFFTIDALIAAIIMIGGLLLITSSHISDQPRTTINHLSQDMLNILNTMQVNELNNTFVDLLIANGSIKDLNNTLLVQIGEFWAEDKLLLANQFIANITEGILPSRFGYSISIDNETLYTRTTPVTNSLANAKKIFSGIQKSKPIKGFVSKARATSISKTSTMTVSFSPEGSGWDGTDTNKGFVYITKYFDIDPNILINNATLYISLHIEDGGSDWNVIDINNGTCIITRDSLGMTEEGYFGTTDVSACLITGTNRADLALWNDGYNGHIHPGMYLAINFNTTENVTYLTSQKSERFYFDNIRSVEANNAGSGAWTMQPFHMPAGATNISAKLHLNLHDVNDLKDRYWSWWSYKYRDAYDFRVYVNSDSPFYQQDAGDSTDIDDCLYYSAACGTEYDWEGSFDITSEVVTGTNVVSVYVNNYGDIVGGDGVTEIYSDPITDADNSSYVEINYTLTPVLPYGVVEIRQTKEFGGGLNPTKDTNFQFPAEAQAISTVFTHIIEQYSYISRVYGDTAYIPANMVFESPSARAVPTDVNIPTSTLDVSELVTNYVRIQDAGGNDIRPESTVDYGFYVPSFVGYGEVFATVEEANNDAIQRLQDEMGTFVNVSNLVLDNTSMADVPSMWGPAIIEVRVWN